MNIGNDGLGAHNTMANVGNDYVCVDCEFGLEVDGQRWSYINNGTHVEDMKDPVEVQPPGRDRFLIILGVESSRDHIPFTPLDDVPLDLGHGPAIEKLVGEPPGACITGPTHVVNCTIA